MNCDPFAMRNGIGCRKCEVCHEIAYEMLDKYILHGKTDEEYQELEEELEKAEDSVRSLQYDLDRAEDDIADLEKQVRVLEEENEALKK